MAIALRGRYLYKEHSQPHSCNNTNRHGHGARVAIKASILMIAIPLGLFQDPSIKVYYIQFGTTLNQVIMKSTARYILTSCRSECMGTAPTKTTYVPTFCWANFLSGLNRCDNCNGVIDHEQRYAPKIFPVMQLYPRLTHLKCATK